MKQLDLTKPVQTRDGRPVRILCTDARGTYPVVGLVSCGDGEATVRWTASGNFTSELERRSHDLVNVPVKRRVTGWMNVYPCGKGHHVHDDRERADSSALSHRIACVPIDIEYTEGDGLDGAQ